MQDPLKHLILALAKGIENLVHTKFIALLKRRFYSFNRFDSNLFNNELASFLVTSLREMTKELK